MGRSLGGDDMYMAEDAIMASTNILISRLK
jgi:hypothetical protein